MSKTQKDYSNAINEFARLEVAFYLKDCMNNGSAWFSDYVFTDCPVSIQERASGFIHGDFDVDLGEELLLEAEPAPNTSLPEEILSSINDTSFDLKLFNQGYSDIEIHSLSSSPYIALDHGIDANKILVDDGLEALISELASRASQADVRHAAQLYFSEVFHNLKDLVNKFNYFVAGFFGRLIQLGFSALKSADNIDFKTIHLDEYERLIGSVIISLIKDINSIAGYVAEQSSSDHFIRSTLNISEVQGLIDSATIEAKNLIISIYNTDPIECEKNLRFLCYQLSELCIKESEKLKATASEKLTLLVPSIQTDNLDTF